MSDQAITLDQAVAQFTDPTLATLRPGLIKDWKAEFADEALADAILANPRLSTRIVTEICASQGQTPGAEPPSVAFRETIGAILIHGELEFARLLGCVWFRKTILDWVTWNTLEEHLPRIELASVRRALTAVPTEAAEKAGAPDYAVEDVDDMVVLKHGLACLSCWRSSLPSTMGQRVGLFLKVKPTIKDPRRAELVTLLARNLLETKS